MASFLSKRPYLSHIRYVTYQCQCFVHSFDPLFFSLFEGCIKSTGTHSQKFLSESNLTEYKKLTYAQSSTVPVIVKGTCEDEHALALLADPGSSLDVFMRRKVKQQPGVDNMGSPIIFSENPKGKSEVCAVVWTSHSDVTSSTTPKGGTAFSRSVHGHMKIPSNVTPSFEFGDLHLQVCHFLGLTKRIIAAC